jgi:hypothetical protein
MSSIIKVDTIQDQDGNNIINENANTITIGKSGDTVTVASGATFVGGGIEWQSSIVTGTTLSAVAGKGYWIDTTSNACTVTLPASASAGDQIIFVDYARNWGTNAITIDQNSLNFQGYSSPNPVYNTNGQSVSIVYSGATQGWIPTVDDDVTDEVPQPYSVDFLVIAGGGGGGGSRAAGGGAGGYRTSTQTVSSGTTITVTVGNGGAGGTEGAGGSSTRGTSGSDSSVSGTGLTTITSTGGGGGGTANGPAPNENGLSGGSGGGATSPGTAGSGNTPSVAPSQGNNGGTGGGGSPGYGAGAGGGAGAVGGNGTTTQGGAGGAGTASSITGSSVTRAGGGGGGAYDNYPGGSATDGGGNGTGVTGGTGSAGAANTGGGGGGGNIQGGAGGSGIVILSMPDASYSGTTTGSPTVATGVSGKTVLTFTGSGSYTT